MADTLIILLFAAIVLAIFLLLDLFRRVKRLRSSLLAKSSPESQPPSTCSHVLIPIACQPLKSEHLPVAYTQTILLKRCRHCGMHVDIGYAGEWTIEDFLKTESSAAKETEILERMMR